MTTEAEEKALHYRRAQSVTRAEEITEKENKVRKSQFDKPIHKPRDSLFSWSSGFKNFTGLVNWGFLMLTIGGLRLCLENFLNFSSACCWKFADREGNSCDELMSAEQEQTIEEEKSDAFLAAGLVRYPDNLNLKDLFYFLLAPTLYWWNANNIGVFWRTWNLPVHKWAVRHVYIPITELGYSKTTASAAVFLISALFHEYLVSVPLQMFRVWAFLGMMVQPPLSVISRFAEVKFGSRWGNIIC
ncbi:hypothetical protein MSG28_002247 [Choristoneura fumiferana]|uniref:Uncharacterized protein n=1 Tax=Choristoneura fumiferana TaxID=7141 RepID=A0ACC0JVG5_CHOFU|nr:hypothetical protein MSG28_002247 [Choristoneura fumiferana]